MKIRRITTAEAPLGAATRTGGLSGTSRVTAGIDLFGSRGFDRFPSCRPGQSTHSARKPGERRRTQTRQEQPSLAGPRRR